MSLQQFKLHMAKTVVNEENASMQTMDTSALLDLADSSQKKRQREIDEEDSDDDLKRYQEAMKFVK